MLVNSYEIGFGGWLNVGVWKRKTKARKSDWIVTNSINIYQAWHERKLVLREGSLIKC